MCITTPVHCVLVLIFTGLQRWKNLLSGSQANFLAELKLAGIMVALLAAAGCDVDAFRSPLASLQAGSSAGNSPLAVSREIDAGVILKLKSGTTQTLKINVLETQPVVIAPILARSDHDQES